MTSQRKEGLEMRGTIFFGRVAMAGEEVDRDGAGEACAAVEGGFEGRTDVVFDEAPIARGD